MVVLAMSWTLAARGTAGIWTDLIKASHVTTEYWFIPEKKLLSRLVKGSHFVLLSFSQHFKKKCGKMLDAVFNSKIFLHKQIVCCLDFYVVFSCLV